MIAVKTRLAVVRTDLFLTQEELAEKSGVGIATISRCENGAAIQTIKAKKILKVLNAKRQESGLPILTIDDLTWKIRGE